MSRNYHGNANQQLRDEHEWSGQIQSTHHTDGHGFEWAVDDPTNTQPPMASAEVSSNALLGKPAVAPRISPFQVTPRG